MKEIPKILFRVTTPKKFRIRNGYVIPHVVNHKYGLSVPTTERKGLIFAAAFLANPVWGIDDDGSNAFLLLVLQSRLLKNLKPAPAFSAEEFFARIPTKAIRKILPFSWIAKPNADYQEEDISRIWKFDISRNEEISN